MSKFITNPYFDEKKARKLIEDLKPVLERMARR